MINYCVAHNREHDHFSWKFTDYETNLGKTKTGWFCGEYFKPTTKEWIPQRIKDERHRYFKDTLMPWRDGEPSREYLEAYPKSAKAKFTDKEIKRAKYVWRDIAPRNMKGGTK